MVRARRETRDRLKALSEQEGTTAIDLLDRLVQEYEDQKMLAWFERDLDPGTLAVLHAEVTEWDGALMDGLDPTEDFSAWR